MNVAGIIGKGSFFARAFESSAARTTRVEAEQAALKLQADTLQIAEARKLYVAKQLESWQSTATSSTSIDELLALPGKIKELAEKTPNEIDSTIARNLRASAVERAGSLTHSKEDVIQVATTAKDWRFNPDADWFVKLNLEHAAPTTSEALALADTLRPINSDAARQLSQHAAKVAGNFDESLAAFKSLAVEHSFQNGKRWEGSYKAAAKSLEDTIGRAQNPVDVMKVLSVASSNETRAQWLSSTIEKTEAFDQSWTLARTARILGNVEAESKALTRASVASPTVSDALAVAAVAREGRLPDTLINDSIIKASALATTEQYGGILELADQIRKGIILEEAQKLKVTVNVKNHVSMNAGSLPQAQTLGQRVMDYFGMRHNAGNY